VEVLEKAKSKTSLKLEHAPTQRKETDMTHSSLELIRAIQHDYEREAERARLLKLVKTSKRTSFVNKLVWLGKDLSYLVFRLGARKRKAAQQS
jgi:hypothetical protein